MKQQQLLETVCKAIGLNTDMIVGLSDKYEVEVSEEQVTDALDYCKRNNDPTALSWLLVRYIYKGFVEKYRGDIDEQKIECDAKASEPYIKYDGEVIVSAMHLRRIIKERKEAEQDAAQLAAPREFHLTEEDKKILLEHGCRKEDLEWIELEANVCRYILNKPDGSEDHDIDRDEAIRLMGRKKFLYNLDRTAFHWSTTEYELLRSKRSVSFESGLLGRYHNKYVY